MLAGQVAPARPVITGSKMGAARPAALPGTRLRRGIRKTVILLVGLAILGYVVKTTFAPFPAPPYSLDALAAGITLVAGIVLPLAYPPLRRGIRGSPLLKAGTSALLGAPDSATDR
jgi:hypothetical protein